MLFDTHQSSIDLSDDRACLSNGIDCPQDFSALVLRKGLLMQLSGLLRHRLGPLEQLIGQRPA